MKTPWPWRLSFTQSPAYCLRSLLPSHTQYVPFPVRLFATHSPSYLCPLVQVCVPNPSFRFAFQSPTYFSAPVKGKVVVVSVPICRFSS